MIEYLILLLLVKYRPQFHDEPDWVDEALKPGAGIEYEPPARKRPDLRIV